jgi:hypothetical protein
MPASTPGGPSRPRARALVVALLAGLLTLPAAAPAAADIGPKPTAQFAFEYEIPVIPITGGQLLQCQLADCSDGRPLIEGGPQGLFCDAASCRATSYGFAPYQQLVIEFSDATRRSQVFSQRAFDAEYRVTVRASDLVVAELAPAVTTQTRAARLLVFCPAALVTIVVELAAAAIYVFVRRRPRSLLGWVVVANVLSLPVAWLLLPALQLEYTLAFVAAEAFVWLFEAGVLAAGARRALSVPGALLLSLVLNLASIWVGLLMM